MSLSICRLQRPVQTNRISTLTSLSFVRSFSTSWTVARWEHYCLYIHCLADWIENWNSSQSETQFYASGSAFEFSNTNMRERERATSETENLYFKLTLTLCIHHQLSFEWNSFLTIFQTKKVWLISSNLAGRKIGQGLEFVNVIRENVFCGN